MMNIDQVFTLHQLDDPERMKCEDIRGRAKEFAKFLVEKCPQSRELSLALTHLQETVMFAVAAIAMYEGTECSE